jgi:hypothetical protein
MDADIKQLATNLKNSSNLYNQVEDWKAYIGLVGDPAWEGYSKFTPTQQKDYADKAKTVYTDAFNKWMEQAKLPTSVQTILSDDPTAKLPSYLSGYLALDPKDPKSVDAYRAQLKKDFGGLKTKDGSSYISNDLIDAVASGKESFDSLDSKVTSAVQTATNKTLGSSASQFSDITNSPTYKSLLNDPSKLTDSYNTSVAKLTKNADTGTWETGGSGAALTGAASSPIGPNGEYQYNGGINQLLNKEGDIDPTLLNQVLTAQQKNVNANKWHAPVYDPVTNKYVSNTSPYSVGLTNMLNGYQATGDFYSPGYKNSLANKQPAAMSSEGIASLKSTFTDPKTSTDLLNLANSVGTDYANGKNPITAGSKLSPTLIKQYQPSTITNAAGKTSPAAKPGAPDLSNTVVPTTTIPAIDTKTPLVQIKDTSTAIPEWKRLGYTSEAAYVDDLAKKAADKQNLVERKKWIEGLQLKDFQEKQAAAALAETTSKMPYLLAQQQKALDFINLNSGNPAFMAQIDNAKSSLASLNEDIKKVNPGLVKEYVPTVVDSGKTSTAGNGTVTNTPNTLNSYWQTQGTAADQRAALAAQGAETRTVAEQNALDTARNPTARGIATNTGGFTSASNMNTNATGTNGAAGITSVLPQPTGTPIYLGPDPNQVNITNAQQQPVNNTPNYATGFTNNASPIYGAPALQENPTPGGIDKAWLSQNASNVQNLINATPATDTARLDQLNNVLAGYNADLNR